jgi:ABC-type phosphate/phosphonate transport system permease subunit
VTDLHEQIDDSPSSDLWDPGPDWTTLAISAALLVAWAAWIAIIVYRLLTP